MHNYQRYGLLGPTGVADPNGIREVIVGTGGVNVGGLGALQTRRLISG